MGGVWVGSGWLFVGCGRVVGGGLVGGGGGGGGGGRGGGDGGVGGVGGDAEFAEAGGGDVLLHDEGPVFRPDGAEGGGGHGGGEPGLAGFGGAVVVGGVDELVGDAETDGSG